jgi:beta-galactosidase
VELFVNGKSLGKSTTPRNGYIFAFPKSNLNPAKFPPSPSQMAKPSRRMKLKRRAPKHQADAARRPGGLQADGSDVAFFDVEVVDAQGRRCPTDEARVDFKVDGPAIWRGGYNSGKINSVNNLYLDTECGINRVAIRSTLTPGTITLTATRNGPILIPR